LIIVNRLLGYKITYYLDFFELQKHEIYTSQLEKGVYYTFSGSAFYQDLNSKTFIQRLNWEKNRESAYFTSIDHFFKCLYDSTYMNYYSVRKAWNILFLEEWKALTRLVLKDQDHEEYLKTFDPNYSWPIYNSYLLDYSEKPYEKYISKKDKFGERTLSFSDTLVILYDPNKTEGIHDDERTKIWMTTNSVKVNHMGNLHPSNGLIIMGPMALNENLLNMLPNDYSLPLSKKAAK